MLEAYQKHVTERAAKGLPPLPLSAGQATALVMLLTQPAAGTEAALLDLIANQVPPGVDEAAKVKAEFLAGIAQGKLASPLLDQATAVKLLGTMLGGYNVEPLIGLLDDATLAPAAVAALSGTLLVYESFNEVAAKAKNNTHARQVLANWAAAAWFTSRPPMPEELTVTVFKVPGETNTDDLSPASEAWSRPDIPLHAQSMLQNRLPGSLEVIAELKKKGHPVAYVGDVVGTGSSRKSGVNSMLWHLGHDIPHVPGKRTGGVVMGSTIAPIYFNTAEDSGMLPIQCEVSGLETGEIITINTKTGTISRDGHIVARFVLSPATLPDEVQAGGRVNLIIGRGLTARARAALGLPPSTLFQEPEVPRETGKGYTLAQKMVGRACNLPGVRPGQYCEPKMTSVGSQDTTGPMTRDELKELACLKFSAPLVMQSFCHTAAYPKPVDVITHQTLPGFISERGGISLRPGDGVIHSWLNRMVLPDTVGTGGDSHTRFPIGISFPAGSGLVAFAAATGSMPLVMPESVLIRFTGTMQPGITLRDLVNAIPYVAIQQGLLTVEKKDKAELSNLPAQTKLMPCGYKKNLFAGTVLEIEGLPDLTVEQAFELADASAERSAAACSVRLNKEPVAEFLRSNVALLKNLLTRGYQDATAIKNRISAMETWLVAPALLKPDMDAQYKAVLEINLDAIREPILACPNDPDDVRLLSEAAGTAIDEVFVGSCMTNIGHFRALARILDSGPQVAARLWVAPPTRMDEEQLKAEGIYSILGKAGARTEIPGCSLCMGNQARTRDRAVVFSTSTRNFDNRIGTDTRVYLGSAELAAVCAVLGRIPTVAEYKEILAERVTPKANEVYRYLNFDRIAGYAEKDL